MLAYFTNLSPVVFFVVALLACCSLVSWAIIVYKIIQIGAFARSTRSFRSLFWERKDFAAIQGSLGSLRDSPLGLIFAAGYEGGRALEEADPASSGAGEGMSADGGGLEELLMRLDKIARAERARLARHIGFLATVGSTAPFIGLFGTVWGIMIAFRNIGATGSTSLDVVAPGISEALITTAIGLAVAIPAVVGFNFLQRRVKELGEEIDEFIDELGAAIRRFLARRP